MRASDDQSPGDDYFNDLSQQPSRQDSNGDQRGESQDDNGLVPKPKRVACVLCRKRKLKCDGNKPSCGTCTRLQHECSYDEVRRKSGPKRGYVKALEARLAQVETLLKTQDEPARGGLGPGTNRRNASNDGIVPDFGDIGIGQSNVDMMSHMEETIGTHDAPAQAQFPHSMLSASGSGNGSIPGEEIFPWEMIGLGLDEPLPTQDVIDELNQAYFEKIHPSLPIIHRPRYYAAMNLAPHMRPPVCLRYAMWCSAASVMEKYEAIQEHFYQRARRYIQQDEMKGHGESMITIAHCQTWALLATYEFKLMYFPRAWMSSGRSSRLALMMGLHRLDGQGLDVKQCLPPPKDWTEREERRRTFWMAFCVDRYSSIGTGWPMTVEEKDILTNLPIDEESYELSKPGKTMTLQEALSPQGAPNLASFAGVILMATLFGRNLTHLHRPSPDDRDDDLNGEFWKRHRQIDNILLNTALTLPDSLRLPSGLNNANTVFMNMNIHTSTICLHQAAIFKADRNRMPSRISAESKVRCISAAAEIASIMRQISHLDLSTMNPFISFCLYVAARVFVQYLKSRPKDTQVRASLQFLLSAMHAIKRKHPLTESFLVQLDVDLETAGVEDIRSLRMISKQPEVPTRASSCPGVEGLVSGRSGDNNPSNGNLERCGVAYGDRGVAMYNQPNQNSQIVSKMSAGEVFGYQTAEMSDYINGTSALELPNRQRTPGSMQGSSHRSPQMQGSSNNVEMDVTPDNSGDQRTPGSNTTSNQNNSSHTSHTGYSPLNQQQRIGGQANEGASEQQKQFNNMFSLDTAAAINAASDLDMSQFQVSAADSQQSGFVLPANWGGGGGGTGFTPGPTGLTPGPTGMTPGNNAAMNEFMSMSETDWNQMLSEFGEWNSGPVHDTTMNDMVQGWRT